MIETFFHLRMSPFEELPNPELFYPGETYGSAVRRLKRILSDKNGLAFILGESGTGKTLLIRYLQRHMSAVSNKMIVITPNLLGDSSPLDLLCRQCRLPWYDPDQLSSMFSRLGAFLRAQQESDVLYVFLFASAHEYTDAQLGEIVKIINQSAMPAQAPLIITGEPPLLEEFEKQGLDLNQFASETVCRLAPLTPPHLAGYVYHRLDRAKKRLTSPADRGKSPTFTPAAFGVLHFFCGGSPRNINIAAHNCLILADALQRRQIDSKLAWLACRKKERLAGSDVDAASIRRDLAALTSENQWPREDIVKSLAQIDLFRCPATHPLFG